MDIFNKLISEKGIKEDNVVNFIESGEYAFLKCILNPVQKYTVRKQIYLFKIFFYINNLLYNLLLKIKNFGNPGEW